MANAVKGKLIKVAELFDKLGVDYDVVNPELIEIVKDDVIYYISISNEAGAGFTIKEIPGSRMNVNLRTLKYLSYRFQ